MPHKHKRKRDDDSNFNLPPTTRIKALPNNGETKTQQPKQKRALTAKKRKKDDTPRAFARLMALQQGHKPRLGLDNGERRPKAPMRPPKSDNNISSSPKAFQPSTSTPAPCKPKLTPTASIMPPTSTQPKILPHERLSDFSLRVDQSLPLVLPKHSTTLKASNVPGVKAHSTKHNRKLTRLQNEWRETEKRRQAKLEDEMEDLEERRADEDLLWDEVRAARGRQKGKRRGAEQIDGGGGGDPWKVLEKRRKDTRRRGLLDVVKEPPVLDRVGMERVKMKVKPGLE